MPLFLVWGFVWFSALWVVVIGFSNVKRVPEPYPRLAASGMRDGCWRIVVVWLYSISSGAIDLRYCEHRDELQPHALEHPHERFG